MCRIFGFRSVIHSQVHQSLVTADNALEQQSLDHPDGWGVSYYLAGAPHIIKSAQTALNDTLFQKVSGIVSSQTVIAHVRKATHGENTILNTHPFQYGHWTFAHNGNIKNFDQHRDRVLARISPEFRRFILGATDSEVFFYFLLTYLDRKVSLSDKDLPLDIVAETLRDALEEFITITGEYSVIDNAGESETYLTFLLTNGSTMVAHQGGKHLHYSTYKSRCNDRDFCPSFSGECEAPTESGYVNHLIFSSEPLLGDNIWQPMQLGEMVGVDGSMKLKAFHRSLNQ